ncbi:Nucleoporin [Venturia nashicola]|uniref:Nucleoporin n=1 Tax=Venturia nashicola TaxID=86259 RepID=A0A4Z1P6T4_9PEZI|nr:Nucleoporin [Venturia nashicola]TLD35332.1 Nucleoporin [Venturia nashicola]
MADTENHGETVIRFKKRRKTNHQRIRKCDDSDDESYQTAVHDKPPASIPSAEPPESSITSQPEQTPSSAMSVPKLVRKRQAEQAQRKLKSVAQASSRGQSRRTNTPATEQEVEMTMVDIAKSRFVPETGKIFTQDKQMDAYVDRKMAELHGSSASTYTASSNAVSTATHDTKSGRYNRGTDEAVFAGKLVEVELGQGAEQKSSARTKKEPRKRSGLGPDGKPWRSRMQRRNSADLARDSFVDQVLGETVVQFTEADKPDAYQGFTIEEQDYADQITRNDQAIDELVAAKWRNNYLAAQADGKVVRKVPPPPGGAKGEERSKGPKLGGSRMARAQMRLQEEKAMAKKR